MPAVVLNRLFACSETHLRFGNQSIKFEITDLAFGKEEAKSIASFEQASAIALTMTDYVMELMRNVTPDGDAAA